MSRPGRPAQANIRIASSTTEITEASTLSVAAPGTASRPAKGYVVQPGDTLSGIAGRLAIPCGWPALYVANRPPPGRPGALTAAGMPQGLKVLLLGVGLVILAVFLAGLVLAVRRRPRQAAGRAVWLVNAGVGSRRGRGGCFRSVAAAARAHPAGVAVPCAVLATGIMLFTFVESAAMRVVRPPGGSGPGSVSAARPGTGDHRLRPRQPVQPVQPALPGSPGQKARSLGCSLEQIAQPLPVGAVSTAGPGRAPRASRNLSSHLPVGGLCDVAQAPPSAAAAGSGGADR